MKGKISSMKSAKNRVKSTKKSFLNIAIIDGPHSPFRLIAVLNLIGP